MSTYTTIKAKPGTIECSEENARTFYHWIKTRGGVATWTSINLSNPGASWSTPALDDSGGPYPKPTWQAANEPLAIVTDPANVIVYTQKLYKAFRVGLRHGDGLSFVLTDGAQRKVDKYLDRCKEEHGDSFYRKGVLDSEGASIGIYYTGSTTTLDKWIAEHGEEENVLSSHDTKSEE